MPPSSPLARALHSRPSVFRSSRVLSHNAGRAAALAALLALASTPLTTGAAARVAVQPVGLGSYGGVTCVFLSEGPLLQAGGRVFPAPISQAYAPLLECVFDGRRSVAGASKLANRDGCLYDTLPWEWGRGERPKAAAFAALALRPSASGGGSAYHLLLAAITEACCAEVRCGYIERASLLGDEDGQLVIGATLSLTESAELITLYGERVPQPRDAPLREAEVEAATDEMIGVALAAGVPIEVDREVWSAGVVPARFALVDGRMRVAVDAPTPPAGATAGAARADEPKLWELSAQQFKALKPSALARALLASSAASLPRPREATAERLRELAYPLLDEVTRNQMLLSDAIAREDYESAQAIVLQARLEVLTDLCMDPTQAEGSYDRTLDQDEWYAEEQRRIYGPKRLQATGAITRSYLPVYII
ncbi:hypothetical protein T492DRAFT_840164 [Pavlovales sp. CCMP2436]|nr:hypothetical protein T492DRAFT_840164 [Pavlovales sp. CCMP2436]